MEHDHGRSTPATSRPRSLAQQAARNARLVWHVALSLREFWASDLNRAVVDLVDPQPGEVLLDLGAGMGPAGVEALARAVPGVRVVAVDPSPVMRAILGARRSLHRLGGLEVRGGTAERLPVESGTVDALWAVNATHHFEDLVLFSGELGRALRPGGRVVLVEEDLSHPEHPFSEVAGAGHHGPEEVDVGALVDLLGTAGLTGASAVRQRVGGRPATVITARLPSG